MNMLTRATGCRVRRRLTIVREDFCGSRFYRPSDLPVEDPRLHGVTVRWSTDQIGHNVQYPAVLRALTGGGLVEVTGANLRRVWCEPSLPILSAENRPPR